MAVTGAEIVFRLLSTVAAVVLVSFAWRLWTLIRARRHCNFLLRSFPSAPGGHWLKGHTAMNMGKEEGIQETEDLTHHLPHYYVISTPASSALQVVHPDTFKTISSTAEPKSRLTYARIREWLGDGLLISSGKKWKSRRRLFTPVFHFDMLKPYVKTYNACTHVLLDQLNNISTDGPVELFEHISLLTLDILLQCLFGVDSKCQLHSGYADYITAVRRLSFLSRKKMSDWKTFIFGNFYYYYLTPDGYRWRKTLDVLHGYSRHLINQRKALRELTESTEIPKIAFIDSLLDAKDSDGNGLTDEDVLSEVDTFLFEGHDTTASGISWFLYNLARHPKHQEKCRQEVDDLLNNKDGDELDWNDIHKMPYTTMCLKESLRIHAPVSLVTRQTTDYHQFPDGNVIQPGTVVSLAINTVHRNPHVWENPEVYDPARFSAENSKSRPSHAFVPFSAGPRNCIGQKFAMHEMKVTTALILRRFDLSVDGCPAPKRRKGFVLRADNGIYVNLKRRNLYDTE